ASLAAAKTEASHPSQTALREVIFGCERAARLTQQLLTFSRGGITEPQSVDLAKTLQALVPMLESVLGSGNRLDVQLPGTPVFVKGSASALDQLLMNLVVNARDAAGSGAHVRITLTTQE